MLAFSTGINVLNGDGDGVPGELVALLVVLVALSPVVLGLLLRWLDRRRPAGNDPADRAYGRRGGWSVPEWHETRPTVRVAALVLAAALGYAVASLLF